MLIQIVHFHQCDSGGVVYATHDRCVVAGWQVCNNRRFPWICWSQSTVEDFLDLVVHYNPSDYRHLPIIVEANQNTGAVVQFQGRISQYVGHAKLSEFRANGTDNHSLWSRPCNDETANHHVVACLDEAAST